VAVGLVCGPGSISQRLLARFPGARAVAVDIDPVMLAIGRGAVGAVDGRLRWVEADLAWRDWLEPEPLTRLYHDLGRLLRPGGLFLSGDHMAYDPALPTFTRLSQRVLDKQWTDAAFAEPGIETAEQWWEAFASVPSAAPLLAERAARFAGKRRQESPPGLDVHVAALRAAGFREVGTIWQVLSNRVLLAVR